MPPIRPWGSKLKMTSRPLGDLHPTIQSIEHLRVEAGVSMQHMSSDCGRSPSWWANTLRVCNGRVSLNYHLFLIDELLERFGYELVIQKIEDKS